MYLGTNIKTLRKKFNITQKELASDFIDRSLLSKIENGERILTETVLTAVINSFNYILKDKKIITANDFLSEVSQYEKLLRKNPTLDECEFIYNDLMDGDNAVVNEKYLYIIHSLGNKLMQFKEYKKTYNLYMTNLDNFLETMNISLNEIIILNITRCILFSGNYELIYNIEKEIEKNTDNFSHDILIKIFYNTHLSNKDLKHFKKCYNYLAFLSDKLKKTDFEIEVELSSVLRNLKKYDEALDNYKKMLKIFKIPEEQVWININITYLLCEISELTKVNKKINEIKNILETQETNKECLSQRYKLLGDFYSNISKTKQAKEYYIKSLVEYNEYKPRDPYPALYYELIERLIALSDKRDTLVFKLIENNFPYLHNITPNIALLMKLSGLHQKNIYRFDEEFFLKLDSKTNI